MHSRVRSTLARKASVSLPVQSLTNMKIKNTIFALLSALWLINSAALAQTACSDAHHAKDATVSRVIFVDKTNFEKELRVEGSSFCLAFFSDNYANNDQDRHIYDQIASNSKFATLKFCYMDPTRSPKISPFFGVKPDRKYCRVCFVKLNSRKSGRAVVLDGPLSSRILEHFLDAGLADSLPVEESFIRKIKYLFMSVDARVNKFKP